MEKQKPALIEFLKHQRLKSFPALFPPLPAATAIKAVIQSELWVSWSVAFTTPAGRLFLQVIPIKMIKRSAYLITAIITHAGCVCCPGFRGYPRSQEQRRGWSLVWNSLGQARHNKRRQVVESKNQRGLLNATPERLAVMQQRWRQSWSKRGGWAECSHQRERVPKSCHNTVQFTVPDTWLNINAGKIPFRLIRAIHWPFKTH